MCARLFAFEYVIGMSECERLALCFGPPRVTILLAPLIYVLMLGGLWHWWLWWLVVMGGFAISLFFAMLCLWRGKYS